MLDEPSTGLHPSTAGLLRILDRLVWAGGTIIIVEHNTDVMRAADWIIELGPGAGQGGRLLYASPAGRLAGRPDTPTGAALQAEEPQAGGRLPLPGVERSAAILIEGARS